MKSRFLLLVLIPVALHAKGDDFRQFMQKDAEALRRFKTGAPAKEREESAAPVFFSEPAPVDDITRLIGPAGGATLEEQHAWRLYRQYQASRVAQKEALDRLRDAKQNIRDMAYGFSAPFVVDPDDSAKMIQAKQSVNAEVMRQTAIRSVWDRRFGTYYGPLDACFTDYELTYPDPDDPMKKIQMVINKIEFRLRAFPYSQRGGQSVKEPESVRPGSSGDVIVPAEPSTGMEDPAGESAEVPGEGVDTRAPSEGATAADPVVDPDEVGGRVPMPDEGEPPADAVAEADPEPEPAGDRPIVDEGAELPASTRAWADMTRDERHEALKRGDPEAWASMREILLTGDDAAVQEVIDALGLEDKG